MKDNLIENVIERNNQDMKRINLLMKCLDKLKSKEVAGRIENILIEQIMKFGEMNKQLKTYLIEEERLKLVEKEK